MGGSTAPGVDTVAPSVAVSDVIRSLTVDGIGVLLAVLVLLALAFVSLAVRRRMLLGGGGTIDCSLRRRVGPMGRGWILGVARYDGDVLKWYRVFSFSVRPSEAVSRRDLTVRRRRMPTGPEALAVNAGVVVVEVLAGRRPLELAMSENALTGFLAWLEAAPPGAYIDHIT